MEKKNITSIWILYIALPILAFFVRAYRLLDRFAFTMDEEYQAFLVQKMLATGDIPFIGVNVSDTGLYLGPFFTWLSGLPLWLSHSHPSGTAWMAIVLGSLTVGLFTFLVQTIFKRSWLSALGGIVYAIHPFVVSYDYKYWNPSAVPLLTLGWLWCLLHLKKQRWWLLGVVSIFGASLHTHYSLLMLLPPTVWWLFRTQKLTLSFFSRFKPSKHIGKDPVLWSLLVLALWILPMLLFEFRHGFMQMKGFLDFLGQAKTSASPMVAFGDKGKILLAFLSHSLGIGWQADLAVLLNTCVKTAYHNVLVISGLLWSGVVGITIVRSKHQAEVRLLGLTLAAIIIGFLVSPLKGVAYYLLPILPLLFLFLIFFIDSITDLMKGKRNHLMAGVAILVVGIIVWTTQTMTLVNSQGLKSKEEVFSLVKRYVGSSPYYLEVMGSCYRYEGYRYLAEVVGVKPHSSYMDAHFAWIYGQPDSTVLPAFDVVILPLADSHDSSVVQLWERWQRTWGEYDFQTKVNNFELLVIKKQYD